MRNGYNNGVSYQTCMVCMSLTCGNNTVLSAQTYDRVVCCDDCWYEASASTSFPVVHIAPVCFGTGVIF